MENFILEKEHDEKANKNQTTPHGTTNRTPRINDAKKVFKGLGFQIQKRDATI